MSDHPTLRDTLTEAVRSHALYRVSGAAELWRCTCKEWETQGLDVDQWQTHFTDALTTAVQPWLDGQAWAELTAERDALRGQLADSEDALERAKTEARIAIAQRDRWRDAAREATQRIAELRIEMLTAVPTEESL